MKRNTYVISGVLLLLVTVGASGCGSSTSASTPAATSSTTAAQTTQKQTNQQNGQFKRGPLANNPALRTVMELRRLQSNAQLALTSDQKAKLKPILQNLINTSNPGQEFLQQQADAMNALLTDQQKSFIAQPRTGQRPRNNTNSNGNSSNGNSTNAKNSGTNKTRPSFQPKDIYQQFLNSLN